MEGEDVEMIKKHEQEKMAAMKEDELHVEDEMEAVWANAFHVSLRINILAIKYLQPTINLHFVGKLKNVGNFCKVYLHELWSNISKTYAVISISPNIFFSYFTTVEPFTGRLENGVWLTKHFLFP